MTTETYEILAIKYAEFTNRRRFESFISADDHDGPHPIDYFVWLIRNANRTHPGRLRLRRSGGHQARPAHRPHAGCGARDARRLARRRSSSSSSRTCTTTMPARSAPSRSARFHLQAAEMAYATGPCMCHNHLRYPFTADHVCEMVRHVYSGRVVFHDGDAEVAPGITVHKVGGHSRGLQCVRVMTATGPVVLASDSSHFYENFEKGKVFPITIDIADVLERLQPPQVAGRLAAAHRAGPRSRSCCSATPR